MAATNLPDGFEGTIVAAPGKWDLMLSVFDGDEGHRRPIELRAQCAASGSFVMSFLLLLNGVQREDGSGECWNLVGTVTNLGGRNAHAFISTKSRTGHLTIDALSV